MKGGGGGGGGTKIPLLEWISSGRKQFRKINAMEIWLVYKPSFFKSVLNSLCILIVREFVVFIPT